jgi:YD repeat-containing protein
LGSKAVCGPSARHYRVGSSSPNAVDWHGEGSGVGSLFILEQVETEYDANSNPIKTTLRRRFHDETDTGALGTPSSGVNARVSYMASYYDLADRLTDSVNVGTNGGSAWTRPGSIPSRSDTVLVTSTVFDSAGRVWKVTDPKGLEARTEYDALGRTTKTIENYVDGTVGDDNDKTTEYTYSAAGMTSLTAKLTGGGGQTTEPGEGPGEFVQGCLDDGIRQKPPKLKAPQAVPSLGR